LRKKDCCGLGASPRQKEDVLARHGCDLRDGLESL